MKESTQSQITKTTSVYDNTESEYLLTLKAILFNKQYILIHRGSYLNIYLTVGIYICARAKAITTDISALNPNPKQIPNLFAVLHSFCTHMSSTDLYEYLVRNTRGKEW